MKLLNKGYTNTTEFKAVPCNIVEKIFEARDKILFNCEDYVKEDYEELYKECFEEWSSEDYALGECVSFLKEFSNENCKVIDVDIYIYTSEHYLATKGKYRGLCKLPNGADILVLDVYGEETGINMCQVVYYDGTMLRTFTPYQGNAVNIATKTCLGDEAYTTKDAIDSELFKKIYPSEVDFSDYDNWNEMLARYYVFTGLVESEDEAENLRGRRIHLDWDSIENEIEKALC